MTSLKPKLYQADAQQAIDWLALELSNIQLAWQFATDALDVKILNQALPVLDIYYSRIGPASLGLSIFSATHASLLENAQMLGESEENDLLIAKIMLAEAGFEDTLANFEKAEQLFQTAINIVEQYEEPSLLARSYDDLARSLNQQGRYQETLSTSLNVLSMVPELDHELKIDCLLTRASTLGRLGRVVEAGDYFRQAYLLANEQKNIRLIKSVMLDFANYYRRQGRVNEAIEYGEKTVQLCEELGDNLNLAISTLNLGIAFDLIGDYKQSRHHYIKARDFYDSFGFQHGLYAAGMNLGRVEHFLGNYEAAYTNYQLALAFYKAKGLIRSLSVINANLALLAHNQGDQKAAIRVSANAIKLAENNGSDFFAQFGYLFKGHAEHAKGDLESALVSYQKVIDICQEINLPPQEIEALAGQACVLLDQQDLKQVMVKIEPVLSFLKENPEVDGAEEPLRLYLSSYKVLEAYGDPRAKEILGAGYKVLMGRADKLEDEALKESYLNNVLVHKELISAYEQSVIETS